MRISPTLTQLHDCLAQQGLGLTFERRLVLEVIRSQSSPFTAKQIVLEAATIADTRRVSLATAYRVIHNLLEAQVLETSDLQPDPQNFQSPQTAYQFAAANNPWASLCLTHHPQLIAGKCPWCGRDIRNGRIHFPYPP